MRRRLGSPTGLSDEWAGQIFVGYSRDKGGMRTV